MYVRVPQVVFKFITDSQSSEDTVHFSSWRCYWSQEGRRHFWNTVHRTRHLSSWQLQARVWRSRSTPLSAVSPAETSVSLLWRVIQPPRTCSDSRPSEDSSCKTVLLCKDQRSSCEDDFIERYSGFSSPVSSPVLLHPLHVPQHLLANPATEQFRPLLHFLSEEHTPGVSLDDYHLQWRSKETLNIFHSCCPGLQYLKFWRRGSSCWRER